MPTTKPAPAAPSLADLLAAKQAAWKELGTLNRPLCELTPDERVVADDAARRFWAADEAIRVGEHWLHLTAKRDGFTVVDQRGHALHAVPSKLSSYRSMLYRYPKHP